MRKKYKDLNIQKDISYKQALKRITDAMQEGLMGLIFKDEQELKLKDEHRERKKVTTKIETLDVDSSDSDNS